MQISHEIPEREISVAAYYIWEKEMSYEALCRLLAERQLYIKRDFTAPPSNMIQQQARKFMKMIQNMTFCVG